MSAWGRRTCSSFPRFRTLPKVSRLEIFIYLKKKIPFPLKTREQGTSLKQAKRETRQSKPSALQSPKCTTATVKSPLRASRPPQRCLCAKRWAGAAQNRQRPRGARTIARPERPRSPGHVPQAPGPRVAPIWAAAASGQTRIWRRDFSRQEDQPEGCRRAQVCHPQHGPQKPPASHTRGCGCTLAGAPPWGVTPRAWALRPRLCLGWHRTRPWERASRPVLSRFLSKPRGPSCRVLCCPLLGLTLTAQGEASCWGRGRPPSRSSPSGCTGPPDFRKAKSQTSCS